VGIEYWYPFYDLLYPVIVSVILTGVVMSSRLRLNEHRPAEVYAGALLGFFVCFFTLYFFLF
jgi:membrane-associated phospholipid phosphatase